MKIYKSTEENLSLLQEFIIPYEHSCTLLASYIRSQKEEIYYISETQKIENSKQIYGILYFDNTLLFCLPPEFCVEQNKSLLENFFLEKTVKCINGEKTSAEYIKTILEQLGQKPNQTNNYKLMILKSDFISPSEKLSCDDEIRRCSDINFDELLELQKMYITKEVAPQGKQVSDLQVSMTLRQVLKSQLMFALFSDGEPVAKANTNAIGFNWIQIGGVFTHPLYRRNGYAWQLMAVLLSRIERGNKKACLFVKEKNIPAIELYQKIGFIESGKFEIDYFE